MPHKLPHPGVNKTDEHSALLEHIFYWVKTEISSKQISKFNMFGDYVNMHVHSLSRVQLFVTSWTVAPQAPLFMGFPRQEYWNGLPFPSPRDLPDPGIEPVSPASPMLAGRFFTTEPRGKPVWR